ncbi:MAG: hypothetical protein ACOX5Q_02425 [Bacillota bacterium]|jgi:hypothetical protein|nr:hypothetical protein [Candidatus Fermentithermobacillaceae bacterium]
MRRSKLVPLGLELIAILCIISALALAGCNRDQRRIDEDIKAIRSCYEDAFLTGSEHYDASPAVKVVFNEEVSCYYLHYSITIDNPKEQMRDVTATGLLNDEMIDFLRAPSLFFTSVLAETPIDVGNDGAPGLVVSRSFILMPRSEIDSNGFREVFQEVRARVTWVDELGNRRSEYFHWTAIDVDDSVWGYLE